VSQVVDARNQHVLNVDQEEGAVDVARAGTDNVGVRALTGSRILVSALGKAIVLQLWVDRLGRNVTKGLSFILGRNIVGQTVTCLAPLFVV